LNQTHFFVMIAALMLFVRVPAEAKSVEGEKFQNPILFADYSDPDVIRDGNSYYLIASTFHFVPGIPILKSNDLVHWTILGHVVPRLDFNDKYSLIGGNKYGEGIWAPAIRRHAGLFYVYFPTPKEGIFVSTAAKITGPWSKPVAVIAKPGLEDPCPFWDDDGKAYLIHGKVGAGPLILHRMAPDGLSVLDEGHEVVNDPKSLPTLEGPKLYKRNGYYYIFAPFGGVFGGPQAVLRSKSIDGPYEHRVVLAQGKTKINGPHQGGYVETPGGQGWFIHFQLRGAHGRIVHLEPVRWENDWPVIGKTEPGIATGEPVMTGSVPDHAGGKFDQRPQTSDEFSGGMLGPQWEWNHNPDDAHWSLRERPGFLRLKPMPAADLLHARNTLTQMMQDESFELTARLDLAHIEDGGHTGLAMFEQRASGLEIVQEHGARSLRFFHAKSGLDENAAGIPIAESVQLRIRVKGKTANYFYSIDEGKNFEQLGPPATISFSWWKGSRPAIFAFTTEASSGSSVDVDWVRYQKLE
jgi:beta-xylosidase